MKEEYPNIDWNLENGKYSEYYGRYYSLSQPARNYLVLIELENLEGAVVLKALKKEQSCKEKTNWKNQPQ